MLLGCSEIKSSTLTNKFEDQCVFEYSLKKLEFFCMLFSDSAKCDVFFAEYLGFEIEDSEERRNDKYQQWGGDILFTLLNNREYEALQLGLDLLRRYNLLQYEISRTKDGVTLLQWVVFKAQKSCDENYG